ncbi:ROK family protein [Clostridium septicum]|uniref:ROK family protein n=1 Tax=Clostridium septicum TaxID=1504 RepID=UPI00272E762F|nr:ROK family protein [Clostridium septicum]WLF69064.1 ROK family protein [Clostridium septicum]
MRNYIVYDIGGSAVKWSVINENGEFLKSGSVGIAETVEEFFNTLSDITNKNRDEFKLEGIAISSPGAVDSESGIVYGASAIPYIHGPNFKEILFNKTGLKVEIENDANCAALGECWLGAGKKEADLAFVVCGTGIGGALVKDKRIHKGVNKHGGEFGYCIIDVDKNSQNKYLTWSKVGSTAALARKIAKRKGIDIKDFNGLKAFELYENNDEIAIEEVNNYFTYMAVGIYNIQYTYDPEVIILGGGISEREGFIEEIDKRLNEIMLINKDGKIKPVVRKCEYGNNANKLGALYNFIQRQG